jgi:hypothetical protein
MEKPNLLSLVRNSAKSFLHWFRQRNRTVFLFIILIVLPPAYILFKSVILPANKALHTYSAPDTLSVVDYPLTSDSILALVRETASLELEKAYLQNRLTLARFDSAYISIDLCDSLLTLELQGIILRKCPIQEFEITRRFKVMEHDQLLKWLSTPFKVRNSISTIPKIRYVFKEAPKDTIEASLQSAKPIPPDTTVVFFTLFCDSHLVIEVEQSEPLKEGEQKLVRQYFHIKHDSLRRQAVHAVFHHSTPDYGMYLRLKVSQADARAIYRGIPVYPGAALKLR